MLLFAIIQPMTKFRITSQQDYTNAYNESVSNPEQFWDDIASHYTWRKRWNKTLEWNFEAPKIEWFVGGKLNITENCLDRHLESRGDKIALIWEANDPSEASQKFTYRELHKHVCRMSNVLKSLGVKKGDRVCIYLPMIPELTFAVLACARIGAVHSVVFAGFSANSIADRINDMGCEFVITADGLNRGNKQLDVKSIVDEALETCPTVKKVLVVDRLDMDAGLHPSSTWNNPEPEVVLIVASDGRIVGATLGNDVNLRDVEGRSALLLGKAKDNNASAAIGPFIRLFDAGFSLDDVRSTVVSLTVSGEDGFLLEGASSLSQISRDPDDLVRQDDRPSPPVSRWGRALSWHHVRPGEGSRHGRRWFHPQDQ